MKPRTQFERLVKFSNERLTEISHKAVDWALRTQVSHIVFCTSGGKCTCGDCGRQFYCEGKGKSVKCPHCGISGNVIDTKKRKFERGAYFNTTEVNISRNMEREYRHRFISSGKARKLSLNFEYLRYAVPFRVNGLEKLRES